MKHDKQRRRRALVAAGLAAALFVGGCGRAAAPDPAPAPSPGQSTVQDSAPIGQTVAGQLNPTGPGYEVSLDPAVIEGQERFGLALYEALLAEAEPGDNIFLSPTSVAIALAMAYNGADGDTRQEMAAVLEAVGVDLETFNNSYYKLITTLQQDSEDIQLRIANGIFQREGFELLAEFLARNKTYFDAALRELDFDAPASVDVINGWVNDQTEGLIPEIISEISPDSVLFLINAIYFKGSWQSPFDPALTQTGTFRLPDGTAREVPMMHQYGDFQYFEDNGLQGVRLPYGEDGDLAMYVLLPAPDEEFTPLQVGPSDWERWLGSFRRAEGTVALPRFQLEFESSLKSALQSLGMEEAFAPGLADFGQMADTGAGRTLFIGDVLHKTFLLVNEEGSEAAAVTGIDVRVTSVVLDPFQFVADRPFFVAIRDDVTGTLLFTGWVASPDPVS